VFNLQPRISDGTFQLRMNNIWSCKVLFLSQMIQIPTTGWDHLNMPILLCWRSTKVNGDQSIFYIFCIFCVFCIFCILYINLLGFNIAWLDVCQSPLYTSSVNQHKSSTSFQCLP
jgi:hypothetical protein